MCSGNDDDNGDRDIRSIVVPDKIENINQKEKTDEANLDLKISLLKEQCMSFVEIVDKPALIRNVEASKYNLADIERLYNLTKMILEI